MESKEVDTTYHPSYASPDADIVLKSRDGVLFRAHSIILSVASGFFRDMLSLPRAADSMDSVDDIVVMDETTDVLKALLDAIYPNSTTVLAESLDFETFRDLMFILTHKYDLDAGEKIARGIYFDERLSFSPILMFGAMQHIGWVKEAKKASTATLKRSLFAEECRADLRRLPSRSVVDLMSLHQKRKTIIMNYLDSPSGFSVPLKCDEHRGGLRFSLPWLSFKHAVLSELESDPSGECFQNFDFVPKEIVEGLKTQKLACHCYTGENSGFVVKVTPDGFPKCFWDAVKALPKEID